MTKTTGWIYLARNSDGLYYIGHAGQGSRAETPEADIAIIGDMGIGLELVHKFPAEDQAERWMQMAARFLTPQNLSLAVQYVPLARLTDDEVATIKGMRS